MNFSKKVDVWLKVTLNHLNQVVTQNTVIVFANILTRCIGKLPGCTDPVQLESGFQASQQMVNIYQ